MINLIKNFPSNITLNWEFLIIVCADHSNICVQLELKSFLSIINTQMFDKTHI